MKKYLATFIGICVLSIAAWKMSSLLLGSDQSNQSKRELDLLDNVEKDQMPDLIRNSEIIVIASAVNTRQLNEKDDPIPRVPAEYTKILETVVTKFFVVGVRKGGVDSDWMEVRHFGIKPTSPHFGGKAPIVFEFNSRKRTAQVQFASGEKTNMDFKNFYLLGIRKLPDGGFGLAQDPSVMYQSVRLIQVP